MRNPLYCAFFILKFYSYVQYFSRLNVALCAGPIWLVKVKNFNQTKIIVTFYKSKSLYSIL